MAPLRYYRRCAAASGQDATFLDGSDSAMLWYRGKCIVAPGEDKDQLITVGLGFRAQPVADQRIWV